MSSSSGPIKAPPPRNLADHLLARHRQLAPSASVRVSPLCLGAMTFGGRQPERYGECSKDNAFGILDYFYEQGGNFVDTANAYQEGQSEVWLGEWMESRQNRDEMVIATKYTTGYRLAETSKIQSNYFGTGSKSLKLSLDASLKKLQTTYIDLLYVHWWDFTTSIPELMHSLDDVVKSGKVLYLGISNTPAWIVTKANQYARDHGLRQFVVYQGMWNAAVRDFERDIIPMCRDEGMALAPYGTLNMGRFQTEEVFKEREKDHDGRKLIRTTELDKKVSKVLERIGKAKDVPLTGIALAYVMHKAPYVFPIVGGRKIDHIKGSHEALAIALSDEEIKEIESAYDFDHGYPHSYLSGTMFNDDRSRPAREPQDLWLMKSFGGGNMDWVDSSKPIKPAQQQQQ